MRPGNQKCAVCGSRFFVTSAGWGYGVGGLLTCSYKCMRTLEREIMEVEQVTEEQKRKVDELKATGGMSGKEIAAQVGVSPWSVYDYEGKKRKEKKTEKTEKSEEILRSPSAAQNDRAEMDDTEAGKDVGAKTVDPDLDDLARRVENLIEREKDRNDEDRRAVTKLMIDMIDLLRVLYRV